MDHFKFIIDIDVKVQKIPWCSCQVTFGILEQKWDSRQFFDVDLVNSNLKLFESISKILFWFTSKKDWTELCENSLQLQIVEGYNHNFGLEINPKKKEWKLFRGDAIMWIRKFHFKKPLFGKAIKERNVVSSCAWQIKWSSNTKSVFSVFFSLFQTHWNFTTHNQLLWKGASLIVVDVGKNETSNHVDVGKNQFNQIFCKKSFEEFESQSLAWQYPFATP